MRRARVTGQAAVNRAVLDLLEKFDYPDEIGGGLGIPNDDQKGMAHYLIVSTSEPTSVQAKADYLVPSSSSAVSLQAVFNEIATAASGQVTIWMAGTFDLDSDVAPPDAAWIRGLGYTGGGGV